MSGKTPCECGFFDRDRPHSRVGGGMCMSAAKLKRRTTAHNEAMEKTERNRQICYFRRKGWTLDDIGGHFGITPQAVSKIWRRDREKYDIDDSQRQD